MRIESALSGMQTPMRRHDITAHDVANVNTPGYAQQTPRQTDRIPSGTRISGIVRTPNSTSLSNTDLAQEAGEQIGNKHALSANAAVLRVQDRMLGECIDLIG